MAAKDPLYLWESFQLSPHTLGLEASWQEEAGVGLVVLVFQETLFWGRAVPGRAVRVRRGKRSPP